MEAKESASKGKDDNPLPSTAATQDDSQKDDNQKLEVSSDDENAAKVERFSSIGSAGVLSSENDTKHSDVDANYLEKESRVQQEQLKMAAQQQSSNTSLENLRISESSSITSSMVARELGEQLDMLFEQTEEGRMTDADIKMKNMSQLPTSTSTSLPVLEETETAIATNIPPGSHNNNNNNNNNTTSNHSQPGAFRSGGLMHAHHEFDSTATITIGENNNDLGDSTTRYTTTTSNRKAPLLSARLVEDQQMHATERERIWEQAQQTAEQRVKQELLSTVVEAEEYKEPFCPRCSWKCKLIAFAILVTTAVIIGVVLNQFRQQIIIAPAAGRDNNNHLENEVCERATALNLSRVSRVRGNSTQERYTEEITTIVGKPCLDTITVAGGGEDGDTNVIGFWYAVNGTGLPLRASTCSGPAAFGTQISVFEGTCGSLRCVSVMNTNPCGSHSSISWPSVSGEQYSILVQSRNESAAGVFVLTIEETVENDFCETAIGPVVTDGRAIAGSTMSSSVSLLGDCTNRGSYRSPRVYYTVMGHGRPLVVQTYGGLSSQTLIGIYSGNCGNLTCVAAGVDDPFSFGSTVNWMANDGELYYVIIHGHHESDAGNFSVSIVEAEVNNLCTTAIGFLKTNNSLIEGSTRNAVGIRLPPYCGSSANTGPGIWYKVIGTGGPLMVSTCHETTMFDTSISVFGGNGDCSRLVCIDGSNDACESGGSIVQWSSRARKIYYILVTGYMGQTGDFMLHVDEFDAVDYDTCEGAINVTLPPREENHSKKFNMNVTGKLPRIYETVGSTSNATFDEYLDICDGGPYRTGAGVWYSVWGTGTKMSASTCDGATFDTQVTVFASSSNDCNDLVCIEWDDDGCGDDDNSGGEDRSYVEWLSTVGQRYFVLVHSRDELGEFHLTIQEEFN